LVVVVLLLFLDGIIENHPESLSLFAQHLVAVVCAGYLNLTRRVQHRVCDHRATQCFNVLTAVEDVDVHDLFAVSVIVRRRPATAVVIWRVLTVHADMLIRPMRGRTTKMRRRRSLASLPGHFGSPILRLQGMIQHAVVVTSKRRRGECGNTLVRWLKVNFRVIEFAKQFVGIHSIQGGKTMENRVGLLLLVGCPRMSRRSFGWFYNFVLM
jgi:hypothetical protein